MSEWEVVDSIEGICLCLFLFLGRLLFLEQSIGLDEGLFLLLGVLDLILPFLYHEFSLVL